MPFFFFYCTMQFLWESFPAWDDANLPQLIYNMHILIWAHGISVATGESWSPRLPVDRIFFSNNFLCSPYSYYTPLQTYWWKKLFAIYIYFYHFPNIARLYEMMEAWLTSWINAKSKFVQYVFLWSFDMLLQTPYATCMWGLMFIL